MYAQAVLFWCRTRPRTLCSAGAHLSLEWGVGPVAVAHTPRLGLVPAQGSRAAHLTGGPARRVHKAFGLDSGLRGQVRAGSGGATSGAGRP